jgi:undecaprenyl-diphosphatase
MFDLELFQFINGFANRSVIADWFVIVIAEYIPYIVGIITIILLVKIQNWKERIRILLILMFSGLLARGLIFEVIRYFYDRPRPFLALGLTPLFMENSYAFPSSHAIILTLIGCSVLLFSRRWGIIFLVFTVINALARIYSGVHWPTDSIAGIAIAIFSVIIATKMFPKNNITSVSIEEKESGE